MSITKPELVKYTIPSRKNINGPLSKFCKEFNLFLIVAFSFSITLSMISLWYCYVEPINIFPFLVIIIMPN